jgi:hypothetical protein
MESHSRVVSMPFEWVGHMTRKSATWTLHRRNSCRDGQRYSCKTLHCEALLAFWTGERPIAAKFQQCPTNREKETKIASTASETNTPCQVVSEGRDAHTARTDVQSMAERVDGRGGVAARLPTHLPQLTAQARSWAASWGVGDVSFFLLFLWGGGTRGGQ